MKNILLGIIAINLTFISFNLALKSVEPIQAQTQGVDEATYKAGIEAIYDVLNKRMLGLTYATCYSANPTKSAFVQRCWENSGGTYKDED